MALRWQANSWSNQTSNLAQSLYCKDPWMAVRHGGPALWILEYVSCSDVRQILGRLLAMVVILKTSSRIKRLWSDISQFVCPLSAPYKGFLCLDIIGPDKWQAHTEEVDIHINSGWHGWPERIIMLRKAPIHGQECVLLMSNCLSFYWQAVQKLECFEKLQEHFS